MVRDPFPPPSRRDHPSFPCHETRVRRAAIVILLDPDLFLSFPNTRHSLFTPRSSQFLIGPCLPLLLEGLDEAPSNHRQ